MNWGWAIGQAGGKVGGGVGGEIGGKMVELVCCDAGAVAGVEEDSGTDNGVRADEGG